MIVFCGLLLSSAVIVMELALRFNLPIIPMFEYSACYSYKGASFSLINLLRMLLLKNFEFFSLAFY